MASSVSSMAQCMAAATRTSFRRQIRSPSVALRTLSSSPKGKAASAQLTTRSLFSQFRPQQQRNSNYAFSSRSFSTSPSRPAGKPTMGQIKSRQRNGPFSWKAALLFVATGAAMIIYFRVEKARLERKRVTEMSKGVGRPKVGGPFVLKDLQGKEFTAEDLKGKYSFVYFGFTHCPDICPDELDKMAAIIDSVKAASDGAEVMKPVFITCDPARDTPQVLKKYLAEFHPDIVGLTGTYQQVKQVCKAYRVYFSTPENVTAGEDYLVDHSIYFYLMDPEGDFVECVGRQDTPESATRLIMQHVNDWKREGKPLAS